MTSEGVLLLHGVGHHRPRGHWLRWLADELRERRIPVQYPQLPSPDEPSVDAWLALARAELDMLGPGGTVIAHSLGTIAWAHLAPTLTPGAHPSRVALVSPPTRGPLERVAPAFAALALGPVDPSTTVIVGRESDPYREEPLEALATRWGAPGVVMPGEGHLTPDDGYGPFPGALAWALGGDEGVWTSAQGS